MASPVSLIEFTLPVAQVIQLIAQGAQTGSSSGEGSLESPDFWGQPRGTSSSTFPSILATEVNVMG